MNLKKYYRVSLSRIAPQWTVVAIDLFLVMISMLLAYTLQLEVSSVVYKMSSYVWMIFFSLLCNGIFFSIFRTSVVVIRFSSFVDISRVFVSLTLGYGMLGIGNFAWQVGGGGTALPNGIVFVAYLLNVSFMVALRILVKLLHELMSFDDRRCVNVFVYGFQGTGVNIAKSMRVSRSNRYRVCGFISDEPGMIGKHVMGCRVYANDDRLSEQLKKKRVHTVIVSSEAMANLEQSGMAERMLSEGTHLLTVPPLSDSLNDGIMKDMHIEDWIRRDPVHIDLCREAAYVAGCRVLVIGAAGAVGREIVRQLAALNPGQLILVDQAESPLYDVQLELSDHWEGVDVRVLVADIANRSRMEFIFGQYMPQLVFHAAAYKDISMLDEYPYEAVRTNVAGTKNVVDLSVKYRAAKCMMISTDCASVPLHVMGYSKRLAEMYVQGMSCVATSENSCTKLMVARFGNVYPHDPRSLMTMPEACQLLLMIGNWGENGGIYIFEEAQAEDLLPTNNEKISQLNVRFTDGGDVCRLIDVLTENSCVQNLENIIDEMKKIISKTAVSKIMV